ncbi:MAG: DUF934 domain-containing protein [Pseudomonadota bacterium]
MSETRIWRPGGFIADDPWHIADANDVPTAIAADARLIVPMQTYLELEPEDRQQDKTAVIAAPDDDVGKLEQHFANLALIALTFPAFNDGRAFSQASLLRSRLGYRGELRATGDVLIDQVPLMQRCGIDSFSITNATAIRRLEEGRLPGITAYYQPAAAPSRATGTYAWRHVEAPATDPA